MNWYTKQINEGTKRNITVCLDQEYNIAHGITFGFQWNGWECPFFTKEVAERVCQLNINEEVEYRYDEEQDAFIIKFTEWENDEEEVYHGYTIDGVKYYPIGNGFFHWEELN